MKKRQPNQKFYQPLNKQSGILLIEVLISILIFSFGLLGLIGLQASSTQNTVNAEERIKASLYANDIVSQLWMRQSLTSADALNDINAWKTNVTNTGLPNAEASFEVTNNVATITVAWKSPSKKSTDNKNRYFTNMALPN